MTRFARCSFAAVIVAVVSAVTLVSFAAAASAADPTITMTETLHASTHLKKLNQDVTIPKGTLTAKINLVTGHLYGHIHLPPATLTLSEAGLPIATATMQVAETKPVDGHVNLSTFAVRATATFNIKVLRASPALLPSVNLVGTHCTTATPVSVTMSGKANLTGTSTFKGTYTIPRFATCGATTLALTAAVSGPGNTFTAKATPQS